MNTEKKNLSACRLLLVAMACQLAGVAHADIVHGGTDGRPSAKPCRDVVFKPLDGGTMLYGDPVHLVDGSPFAKDPTVVRHGGRYLMYYSACCSDKKWRGAIAASTNLVDWVRVGDIKVDGAPFEGGWAAPCVKKFDGLVHLFAQCPDTSRPAGGRSLAIWHATSHDGLRFALAPGNPVLAARNSWSLPRAIDAEAYRAGDRMMMAFATRDAPAGRIQQQGLAWAPYGWIYIC